jgi:hypothetical protein
MFPFRRRRLGLEGQSVKKLTFRRQGIDCLVRGDTTILSCLAISRHPSLRSGRRPSSLRSGRRLGVSSQGAQAPRDPSPAFGLTLHEETPRLTPRGDKKDRSGASPFHSFRAKPHLVISSEARNLFFDNWRPLGLRLGVTKGSIGHPSANASG